MISAWWLLLLLLVVPAYAFGRMCERLFGKEFEQGFVAGERFAYENPELKELFVDEKNV